MWDILLRSATMYRAGRTDELEVEANLREAHPILSRHARTAEHWDVW